MIKPGDRFVFSSVNTQSFTIYFKVFIKYYLIGIYDS